MTLYPEQGLLQTNPNKAQKTSLERELSRSTTKTVKSKLHLSKERQQIQTLNNIAPTMSIIQSKVVQEQENMIITMKKKTIEKKVPEMTDTLRLSYEDFKTSIINMFKNFKKRQT